MARRFGREAEAKVPSPPPGPRATDRAQAEISDYLAKGRNLPELAAALRACSRAERALLGAAVPFTTGTTGARCDQLRALFAGIEKES